MIEFRRFKWTYVQRSTDRPGTCCSIDIGCRRLKFELLVVGFWYFFEIFFGPNFVFFSEPKVVLSKPKVFWAKQNYRKTSNRSTCASIFRRPCQRMLLLEVLRYALHANFFTGQIRLNCTTGQFFAYQKVIFLD